MLRLMILLVFSMGFPVTSLSAQEPSIDEGEAVMQLLELFTSGEDRVAIAKSRVLLRRSGPHAPSVALRGDIELPWAQGDHWNQRAMEREALMQLGGLVAAYHEAWFPDGLPSPKRLEGNRFIALFFDGLWSEASYGRCKKPLNRLLDDSWVLLARDCGAYGVYHQMMVRRVGLESILHEYQNAGDDVALMLLGRSVNNLSSLEDVNVDPFTSKTLAFFLTGLFGGQRSDTERTALGAKYAVAWSKPHPELLETLVDVCGDEDVMRFCDVETLRQNGEYEAAVLRLFSGNPKDLMAGGRATSLARYTVGLILDGEESERYLLRCASRLPIEFRKTFVSQLRRMMVIRYHGRGKAHEKAVRLQYVMNGLAESREKDDNSLLKVPNPVSRKGGGQ